MPDKAVVLGAAGFAGVHLVARLKREGMRVTGVDRKDPDFGWIIEPDDFLIEDLRSSHTEWAVPGRITEVFQLAAEVGGLGYIMDRRNDAEMLANSMRINLNALEEVRRLAEIQIRPPRIFFASSACVYPSLPPKGGELKLLHLRDGEIAHESLPTACREPDAYPFDPNHEGANEYAVEKLFAERLYDAYARCYGTQVRIGRLHNYFGEYGTYQGGREKAPAAMCRKVAASPDRDAIEVWGDGTQTRSFMYVDDAVEGMVRLMRSDFQGPVNIGSSETVTVDQLAQMVIGISGKDLGIRHVDGPVGVMGRSSDNTLIRQKLGWEPSIPLSEGLRKTYCWIAQQVERDKMLDEPVETL